MRKTIIIAVIFVIILTFQCAAQTDSAEILMEASTLSVLEGTNENVRLPMASVTKIMTALIVIENCSLTDLVVIDDRAVGVEGSSMYLKQGQIISVENLLYGLMLSSGNDAAVALAIYVSDSVEEFVKLMNKRVEELNLKNTQFMNPSGLSHNDHYSSAYDLAILTAFAIKNKAFADIVKTKTRTVDGRTLTNHNKLLWSLADCIGVKTGYTIASGRCLVSAIKRDGIVLICVTLNYRDDWNRHKTMYEENFKRCSYKKVLNEKQFYVSISAADGGCVACYNESLDLVVVDNMSRYRFETVLPRFIYTNKKKGDTVGKLLIYSDDVLIGERGLILDQTPKEIIVKRSFFDKMLLFILQLFGI